MCLRFIRKQHNGVIYITFEQLRLLLRDLKVSLKTFIQHSVWKQSHILLVLVVKEPSPFGEKVSYMKIFALLYCISFVFFGTRIYGHAF